MMLHLSGSILLFISVPQNVFTVYCSCVSFTVHKVHFQPGADPNVWKGGQNEALHCLVW